MSFLSVTSKKTRVHLSPDHLSTITTESCHNQHDDFVSDVAVLPLYKSFIQIHKSSKDSWINICKIKKENDKENIQLCVKNKVENLQAVGATKKKSTTGLQFAVGYSTGQIRIRELQTSKLVTEFPAPTSASSVFFLDYNSSDEHLVSVHEDGLINIYGMQTSVKLHSFTLDNQSTLARFHPNKKSILGVASYSGKVSVLDIYTKKLIFKVDGHSAPCSDIAMFDDFLLSSGYDSLVKIYDLRKKTPAIQVQACYGWTTISLSKCGAYFVGGNMKGELISYDMRYMKKPLASARIENSNHKISRVTFLTCDDEINNTVDLAKEVRQSLCKIEEQIDERKSSKPDTNDSFIEDILGFQKGRISDFSSSAINYGTRVSTASRPSSTGVSDAYENNMQEMFQDFANDAQSPAGSVNLDDSRVNKNRRKRMSLKDAKLRSSLGTVLQEINEETTDKENDSKCANLVITPTTPNIVNPQFSSTPTIIISNSNEPDSASKTNKDVIEIDGDDSFKSVQNGDIPKDSKSEGFEDQSSTVVKYPNNFDFRKEFDALAEKIHIEVGSLSLDQNMQYMEIMTHVGEQRRQLQSRIEMIEESLAILLNDDFKINLINELQAENQQLRQQVNNLTRRLSH